MGKERDRDKALRSKPSVSANATPAPHDHTVDEQNCQDEVQRVERALRHRLEMEKLVASLSTRFINAALSTLDAEIHRALRCVGEFVDVDRSYIYLLSPDGDRIIQVYEWCAEGVTPLPDRYREMSVAPFHWAARRLLTGEILYVPRLADLPPDARPERTLWELYGVRSLLAIPLAIGEKLVGFLGFNTEHQEKAWEEEDIRLLKLVGEIFAGVLARKRAEEAQQRRNRDLTLLNQASQAFSSNLDLDSVLKSILAHVRTLMRATGASIWLLDPETDELVCKETTEGSALRGWRLAPGEGIAGWTAMHGQCTIVPDTRADERYFQGVAQKTGVALRSILSVPLRTKQHVIGTLQVVDTQVHRFHTEDVSIMESLATTAAIAIENARLFEQTRRDAEVRATLLQEINHRVKNNLASIIGLLYTELRYAGAGDAQVCREMLLDLINRIQGMSQVHALLSAAQWAPLPLDQLCRQIISAALQTLPRDKHVDVDVSASPVRVTSNQANNLALIINELTANTVKHALADRGRVQIRVNIMREDADLVRLEFHNDGPGYPKPVLSLERRNLGMYLITTLVERGLRGELELRNVEGATAIIRFRHTVPTAGRTGARPFPVSQSMGGGAR
jgi:GAF domain-containing protein/anti-sigma regulatory factor (Ser/Thr protein kinase)